MTKSFAVAMFILVVFVSAFGQNKAAGVSVDDIIRMKKAGVSDEVIKAVVASNGSATSAKSSSNSDQTTREPGIYAGSQALTVETFQSEAFNAVKGLGKAVFKGPFGGGATQKAIANGVSAQIRLSRTATFTFVGTEAPQSFKLVRLEKKSDKRQVVILKVSVTGRDTGFEDKKVIRFTSTPAGEKRWTVQLQLDPGEYMFFVGEVQLQEFSGASLRGTAYTFGVD